MAAGKRLPVKHANHLRNLLVYLVNANHPKHIEYDLSDLKPYSSLNATNFLERADEALTKINQVKKKGRKLETIAHYFIFRFVDGTNLNEEECAFYESEMVKMGLSSQLVLSNHHDNSETGSTDFNFVQAGWNEEPFQALRSNKDDLLKRVRRVSNSLIRGLNIQRKADQRPYIIGVLDVMRVKNRLRQISTVEDDVIIAKETQQVTADNLPTVLSRFGHELAETSKDGETVSIIPRGRKKAIRLNLDALLEATRSAEEAIIDGQIRQLECTTHRDQNIEEILEIPSQTKTLRPQGRRR